MVHNHILTILCQQGGNTRRLLFDKRYFATFGHHDPRTGIDKRVLVLLSKRPYSPRPEEIPQLPQCFFFVAITREGIKGILLFDEASDEAEKFLKEYVIFPNKVDPANTGLTRYGEIALMPGGSYTAFPEILSVDPKTFQATVRQSKEIAQVIKERTSTIATIAT